MFNVLDIVGYIMLVEIVELFGYLCQYVCGVDQVVFFSYCYDDFGMVVVNLMVVIGVGVCQVECIINGIGECVGNVVLEEIVMVLKVCKLFFGVDMCIDMCWFYLILCLLVQLIGQLVLCNKVIVGENVFVYELGIYQYGMFKYCGIYEIMWLQDVGIGEIWLVLGKYFGCVVLCQWLELLGYEFDEVVMDVIFVCFKILVDKKCEVYDEDLEVIVLGQDLEVIGLWCIVQFNSMIYLGSVLVLVKLVYDVGYEVSEVVIGDGLVDVVLCVIECVIGYVVELIDFSVCVVSEGGDVQGQVQFIVCYVDCDWCGYGISIDIVEVIVFVVLVIVNCIECQQLVCELVVVVYL